MQPSCCRVALGPCPAAECSEEEGPFIIAGPVVLPAAMSLASRKKIVKEAGAEPSELEEQVAQVSASRREGEQPPDSRPRAGCDGAA